MSVTQSKPISATAGYWRAATLFLALLLVLGTAAGWSMFEQFSAQVRDLQQKLQRTAQLQYVAVLQDDNGEPALLITQVSGESALQVQRLNGVVEGGDDSLQLWAVPVNGPARSLGTLQARLKTVRVAADEQTLAQVPTLAISVENKGGAGAGQGPRLPYLWSGRVIRKAI